MIVTEVVRWFGDGEHWRGTDGVPNRLVEHLELSGSALVLACLVALPIALTLGHIGRGGVLAVNVSNVGRALPSLALLGICSQVFGFGSAWPSILALTALAIPPIITNTYVGMRDVDRDTVEAARGMGLSGVQVLRQVELPLAAPLLLAGLRTAAVQVVATAGLAALFAQGGLGRLIVDGQATGRRDTLLAGAVLVAALAIVVDGVLGLVQRRVSPLDRARAATLPGAGDTVDATLGSGAATMRAS